MDKLEEPKPADHIQCARKAIVVSWETFSERHKVKAEGIPASTKSWNFPSCWNGGFKHCLPHVKCLLSSSACTSGICPPKSGGVLGKNQFCIISLNRRVPKALWGQVCFVCCLVLGFIYFFFEQQCVSPASKEANVSSTLELCSLHFCFCAGSHSWLRVVAAAGELNFRDVPGLAARSKFRSLRL